MKNIEMKMNYKKEIQAALKEGRPADLRGADMNGADMRGAILQDAKFSGVLTTPPDPTLKAKILAAIEDGGGGLDMREWHDTSCATTHCIAGWAVHLHPKGYKMEAASSTYLAGRLLLFGTEADPAEAEIFYASNEEAMEWLKGGTT